MSDPQAFKAKLRDINFGAPRKPTRKVVDGVEHREVINEQTGRPGTIHSHHLGSETVDAQAFLDPIITDLTTKD